MEPGWPFGGRPTPERLWSLWNTAGLMEAEIDTYPLALQFKNIAARMGARCLQCRHVRY
jgi:hypothetical protein